MRFVVPLMLACAIVALLIPSSAPTAEAALSDGYRYKWPWLPGAGYVITTLPYQGVHNCATGSCLDAYDFVIANDDVRSSDQALIVEYRSDVTTCGPSQGYGKYVVTQENYPYGTYVTYAHLATVAQTTGTIYQGDYVGQQGETGNVLPCPGGKHLHFEFDPGRPELIDNRATNFTTQNPDPPLASTNSPAGEDASLTPFPAIRNRFVSHGGWIFGWTHDVGRPELPFPQGLYVHNYRVWGWEQTFAHDPYYIWGKELGLYTPAWDQGVAGLIEQPYWGRWNTGALLRGVYRRISLPLSDRDACPPGSVSTCAGYQRFHLGYIWNNWSAYVYPALWCPDVAPPYPNRDNRVNIIDAQLVALHMGPRQGEPGYDPWYDINGDTALNILDPQLVAFVLNTWCYPT